jgi:hypothetical protein
MGSWVTYGLGSVCEDLPGFIVLTSGKSGRCGTTCWGSGFLPSVYQGVPFRSSGEPVLYLDNPPGLGPEMRRATLDAIKEINHGTLADVGDPEIARECGHEAPCLTASLRDSSVQTDHVY